MLEQDMEVRGKGNHRRYKGALNLTECKGDWNQKWMRRHKSSQLYIPSEEGADISQQHHTYCITIPGRKKQVTLAASTVLKVQRCSNDSKDDPIKIYMQRFEMSDDIDEDGWVRIDTVKDAYREAVSASFLQDIRRHQIFVPNKYSDSFYEIDERERKCLHYVADTNEVVLQKCGVITGEEGRWRAQ